MNDSWKRNSLSKLKIIYKSMSPKHTSIVAMKAQQRHCCAVWHEEGMFGVHALLSSKEDKRVKLPSCPHYHWILDISSSNKSDKRAINIGFLGEHQIRTPAYTYSVTLQTYVTDHEIFLSSSTKLHVKWFIVENADSQRGTNSDSKTQKKIIFPFLWSWSLTSFQCLHWD